jgi:MFS family permease
MVYCDVLMLLVIGAQLITLDVYFLIATRFIQGMIIGVSGIVIPTYLMSISPTKISGKIGSLNQILITIGIALGYAMGYRISETDLGNIYNWRICVSVPALMCVVRIVACKLLPMNTIERHI